MTIDEIKERLAEQLKIAEERVARLERALEAVSALDELELDAVPLRGRPPKVLKVTASADDVLAVCAECGKEFVARPSRLGGRPQLYCSPRCGWQQRYKRKAQKKREGLTG